MQLAQLLSTSQESIPSATGQVAPLTPVAKTRACVDKIAEKIAVLSLCVKGS
jgi:hypothetical protein